MRRIELLQRILQFATEQRGIGAFERVAIVQPRLTARPVGVGRVGQSVEAEVLLPAMRGKSECRANADGPQPRPESAARRIEAIESAEGAQGRLLRRILGVLWVAGDAQERAQEVGVMPREQGREGAAVAGQRGLDVRGIFAIRSLARRSRFPMRQFAQYSLPLRRLVFPGPGSVRDSAKRREW